MKALDLRKKSFAIYGLGATGKSIINYFNRKKFKNYTIWDDNKDLQLSYKLNNKKRKFFFNSLNFVDFILISPGINIKKIKNKKILLKNKKKIITDLDLFYLAYPRTKSIVVTGTNGKSTTCKIIEHVLKKNNKNVILGGNIGRPVLNLITKKDSFLIIEASSFQLSYSKFIKPNYALLLNITNDHLDWHGTMNNYIKSKLKIFSLQDNNDFAFIENKNLIKKFRKSKFKSKLKLINSKNLENIKKKINNNYLKLELNQQNLGFVYELSQILKINKRKFYQSLKSFKGLPHRYEVFLKKNNKKFINDSKATTFKASKFALKNNKNIFWIFGGLPKIGDKYKFKDSKKNILKTYIIGKKMKILKKHLGKKENIKLCGTLKNAVISIFKDAKKKNIKKYTVLLSPACASYDQFENFEYRGDMFKNLIKKYSKKYL